MKIITQKILFAALLITTITACRKTPVNNTEPLPTPGIAISKIELDMDTVNIVYNTDGTIKNLITRSGNASAIDYIFHYESGKLKEISFDGKWKYYYTGNLLTKVETINASGNIRWQTDLTYTNGQVTEKTEWRINNATVLPYVKTKYAYYPDGNVSLRQVYQYINNGWQKSEEILVTDYDHYTNTSERFENLPYLPGVKFAINNPLRETWKDANGTVTGTVEYAYTYDNSGRPISRNATYKYPGFPDTVVKINIYY